MSQTREELFSRDGFTPVGLRDGRLKLLVFLWRKEDDVFSFVRQNRDDLAFGKSESLNHDLAGNDPSGSDLHTPMLLPVDA